MKFDWRAVRIELRKIRRNPEDTEAGVRLLRALGGAAEERRYFQQLRESREAGDLLRERPDLLGALTNRAHLRALPDHSVGRAYLAFVEREQLCPLALHETLEKMRGETVDPDLAYLTARSDALHDLLHVITGYGRDSAGEIALLAFTGVQDDQRQAVWLSRMGCVMVILKGRFDLLNMFHDARKRGRRSPWMFAQDWSALLGRPIDEVRRDLKLWPVPIYRS